MNVNMNVTHINIICKWSFQICFAATETGAESPPMGAELGSNLINTEKNLPYLLMAAAAR